MRLALMIFCAGATGFVAGAMAAYPMAADIKTTSITPVLSMTDAQIDGTLRAIDEQRGLIALDTPDPFAPTQRRVLIIAMNASTTLNVLSADMRRLPFPHDGHILPGAHLQALLSRTTGPLSAQRIVVWP